MRFTVRNFDSKLPVVMAYIFTFCCVFFFSVALFCAKKSREENKKATQKLAKTRSYKKNNAAKYVKFVRSACVYVMTCIFCVCTSSIKIQVDGYGQFYVPYFFLSWMCILVASRLVGAFFVSLFSTNLTMFVFFDRKQAHSNRNMVGN